MRAPHPGRPGTPVIPEGWAAAHRPVAEKTMTATASIREPGGTPGWDEEAEESTLVPHDPYFTGPCRVQALATQAGLAVVAEDPETVASYLITVPASVTATEEQLVTVTDTGDPALEGKTLRIRQVVRGSLRFERDLICTFAD